MIRKPGNGDPHLARSPLRGAKAAFGIRMGANGGCTNLTNTMTIITGTTTRMRIPVVLGMMFRSLDNDRRFFETGMIQ